MPRVKRQKSVNLAPTKVLDLNTPCHRASQELQNEYLSFENDHSKLKLWALKDSYQNQRNTKGYSPRVQRQKFVNLAPSKVLDLNTPCHRASQELQNEYLSFENDHSKLKLWALKDSYQNQRNTKGYSPRVQRQKFVNLAPSKVLDLNTPCDRTS